MTKTDALSRRKLLGRIGLLAAAGYTVPALTTLSVAQAGSNASGGASAASASNSGPSVSGASASNSGPSVSGASASNSGPSTGSSIGGGTGPTAAEVEAKCGVQNINDPAYLQCLVDNGF